MTYARPSLTTDFDTVPRMPFWVTSGKAEAPEDAAFLSGAALSYLHMVLGHDAVPQVLLRERLALRAAEVCVAHTGRMERAGELRDAVHFLQPGDHPGPAGDTYLFWRRAVERPISIKSLHRALPHVEPEQIGSWLDAGQGAPIAGAAPIAWAASVIEAVLKTNPRAQAQALLLADAALAQSLGGTHVIPLLGRGLRLRDLRVRGDDLRLVCHRAVVTAVKEATQEATDLARRAARLRAVAPKLRAKGSDEAVALFLTRDAVAPAALTSLRSDRAARRLCDRLVDLGAVRELTGRDTFRLYGV